MDTMEICLVVAYSFFALAVLFLLFACLWKFFCRLTNGKCDSNADMTGKTVLITGASAGIGKATAVDMARRNARVILACRNMEKANQVAEEIIASTGNRNVVVKHLDLASFKTVRKCAEDVLRTEEKLHVLINNAGVFKENKTVTEDGYEYILQSNHFGHFLLTMLLLDLLKKSAPSRIINVSSVAYKMGKLELDELIGKNCKHQFAMYARSKLANILFTRELASRLENTGVTVNALHPGAVNSDIYKKIGIFDLIAKTPIKYIVKSCEEGAQTTIHLAVHPDLEKTTGKYFEDCREKKLVGRALDETLAKQLIEISEKIVGLAPTKSFDTHSYCIV